MQKVKLKKLLVLASTTGSTLDNSPFGYSQQLDNTVLYPGSVKELQKMIF